MKDLNWNSEDNTPLEFIKNYWKWIETTSGQG